MLWIFYLWLFLTGYLNRFRWRALHTTIPTEMNTYLEDFLPIASSVEEIEIILNSLKVKYMRDYKVESENGLIVWFPLEGPPQRENFFLYIRSQWQITLYFDSGYLVQITSYWYIFDW